MTGGVAADRGQPGEESIRLDTDLVVRPCQPGAHQAVPVVDDQVRPPDLPTAESGELQWQAVDRGVETSTPTRLPVPNGPASPVLQHQAGTIRAGVDHVARAGRGQGPAHD